MHKPLRYCRWKHVYISGLCCALVGPCWWQRWPRGAWRHWLSCESYSKCVIQKCLPWGSAPSPHQPPAVPVHNLLLSLVSCCTRLWFRQGTILLSLPKAVKSLLKARKSASHPALHLPEWGWKNEQDHLSTGLCENQGDIQDKVCMQESVSLLHKSQDWCACGWRFFHGKICEL